MTSPSRLSDRPRRLRRTESIRAMVRETRLEPANLTYPLFLHHGTQSRQAIASLPDQYRWSVDLLPGEARELYARGIRSVLLFGLPARKDALGSENFAADGIVQQGIRAIKEAVPEMVVITDVCLCQYTKDGHCGLVDAQGNVQNDETLVILQQVALSHAAAGADIVAPSGMMDYMVQFMRTALDADSYPDVAILSYAVKYASSFYGPFREAAEGAPQFGDRKSYQMDPANRREAMREIALDLAQGADMIMVKPALAYLDIVREARHHFPHVPLAAYSVSGEYAMLMAAAQKGWLCEVQAGLELLLGMKRAGADQIVTYHARKLAEYL